MNKEQMELFEEASIAFEEALKMIENEQEEYWISLSKEHQLMAFCAVVRRIQNGEFVHHRSYRGMLYDIFGFGPEAYVQAQDAGFLEIHNAIVDSMHVRDILMEFCKENNIENAQEKVDKYISEYH